MDKSYKKVLDGFIIIVNESEAKSNKLWVDQKREFYNNLIQKWLYWYGYNESRLVVTESFT